MPILEHIGELRKRLIAVLFVFVIGLVIGVVVAKPAYDFLMSREPLNGLPLHTFSLWDGIGIYMKFAMVIALVLTLPFTFFQIWAFVKPGLGGQEQKATLKYIPFTVIMFVIGLAFSYFVVFPMAYYFTTEVARQLNLIETYGVIQYLTFMFNIIIPISLLFELPIVIMFLTKLRILNPLLLKKKRRIAYFVMVLTGTLITPPDVISDIMVAVPLIILYEFSVFLSSRVYRKQLEQQAKWEEEFSS
ncbi:twin-arginine translocase subunit TatC [Paenibacillus sp. GCM10012307]|uniref:Sec-independent protein translocase protein TatC n=1 Tax=Paenibacillus roseus TaxID=2798579 RepID=A0A934MTM6_9BACL|nr:twin-arginine translocase subunit TatC [Paenibacillus roseus]MBJ6360207.1 twin-arginine translocase subunit TatC [Paenibacillus roseus]